MNRDSRLPNWPWCFPKEYEMMVHCVLCYFSIIINNEEGTASLAPVGYIHILFRERSTHISISLCDTSRMISWSNHASIGCWEELAHPSAPISSGDSQNNQYDWFLLMKKGRLGSQESNFPEINVLASSNRNSIKGKTKYWVVPNRKCRQSSSLFHCSLDYMAKWGYH